MPQGYVKAFYPNRGFGFIRRKGEAEDLFLHIRNVYSLSADLQQDMPQAGDVVEYEVGVNKKNKKPEAVRVFIRSRKSAAA